MDTKSSYNLEEIRQVVQVSNLLSHSKKTNKKRREKNGKEKKRKEEEKRRDTNRVIVGLLLHAVLEGGAKGGRHITLRGAEE